jgi:hypothetical protein
MEGKGGGRRRGGRKREGAMEIEALRRRVSAVCMLCSFFRFKQKNESKKLKPNAPIFAFLDNRSVAEPWKTEIF